MNGNLSEDEQKQAAIFKEELKSYKTGFGLLYIVISTLGRSIQVFSRLPGTTGGLLMLANLFSMGAQYMYYFLNSESTGHPDAIAIVWIMIIQGLWFIYAMYSLFRFRLGGVEPDINDAGIGFLYRYFPNSTQAALNFSSDMLVGLGLAGLFYLFDSPIQGSWYLGMSVGLLFLHKWLWYTRTAELNRINHARFRAEAWSQRMNSTGWN